MRQGFDISINDYNRELFTTHKTILEMKDEETPGHVLLKVVACALFHEPGILIEPNDVDPQYKPDLLIKNVEGRPATWIECGQVRTVKLDKLTSRYTDTKFIVVKKLVREMRDLLDRCTKEVRRPHSIRYVAFDREFIDSAATRVSGKNDCIAIVSDNSLQFIINGSQFDTEIHHLEHEPLGYRG